MDFLVNKYKLGKELKEELAKEYDVIKISRLGFRHLFNNIDTLEPDLRDILKHFSLMEEDPKFVLTEEQVRAIADKLLEEGEKEEFSVSDPTIKDIAEDLRSHWLMCPLCQEAWENHIKYPMVRCPQCHQSLHNPCSKSAVKWSVKVNSPKNRLYEIKYLPDLGYCLYVFENDVRIYDDLQDSWESAIGCAWKQFNVDKNLWKKDEL